MSSPVRVAVVDSGVNVPHPHLPRVAGGFSIDLHGREGEDYVDRLGHGTAVAAAIHEKAPDAEILVVKVFETSLATSVPTLVRAIERAIEEGARLVNLSLGTPNDLRARQLRPAVDRALEHGVLIVSAREHEGAMWFPGSMEGVVGVRLDWDQPRETVVAESPDGTRVLRASGYPRPIPGVPPRRNLHGISFAVANATGALAARLVDRPDVRTPAEAIALFEPG
jgi:subtilisin family serine protease